MSIKIITGKNASGKSIALNNIAETAYEQGKGVVSNLKCWYSCSEVLELDKRRIDLLKSTEIKDNILYCNSITVGKHSVIIDCEDVEYGTDFCKYLMLFCRAGDVLILEEPEMGLTDLEIYRLADILELISETYEEVVIATHERLFYQLALDNLFLCERCKLTRVEEIDVYAHIG